MIERTVKSKGQKILTPLVNAMASKHASIYRKLGAAEYNRQTLVVRKILKELVEEFRLPLISVAVALVVSDEYSDHDRDLILAALVDELASTLVAEVH